MESDPYLSIQSNAKVIWLGGMPWVKKQTKKMKNSNQQTLQLTFHDKRESFQISIEKEKGEWLFITLPTLSPSCYKLRSYGDLKVDYETHFDSFELFWYATAIQKLREFGLLVV